MKSFAPRLVSPNRICFGSGRSDSSHSSNSNARRPFSTSARFRSTIDGIVSDKKLSAGEFVNQEGYIVTLARLDPLNVEVYLPVGYFRQVRVGMQVTVSPAPPIASTYAATISVVDRVFDPASGTFGVRLSLPNPDNLLPGGQRCKVSFPFETAQER